MTKDLTDRQRQCLEMSATLLTKQIAHELGISENSVKKHIHEACRRLGVNNRKAALRLLVRDVPPTIGAMGGTAPAPQPSDVTSMETPDGVSTTASTLNELDRSGRRAQRAGGYGHGPDRAGSPDGMSEGRRRQRGPSDLPAGTGGQHPAAQHAGRFGYRPPPAGWLWRLAIIVLITLVAALSLPTVIRLVNAGQHDLQTADRAPNP